MNRFINIFRLKNKDKSQYYQSIATMLRHIINTMKSIFFHSNIFNFPTKKTTHLKPSTSPIGKNAFGGVFWLTKQTD